MGGWLNNCSAENLDDRTEFNLNERARFQIYVALHDVWPKASGHPSVELPHWSRVSING